MKNLLSTYKYMQTIQATRERESAIHLSLCLHSLWDWCSGKILLYICAEPELGRAFETPLRLVKYTYFCLFYAVSLLIVDRPFQKYFLIRTFCSFAFHSECNEPLWWLKLMKKSKLKLHYIFFLFSCKSDILVPLLEVVSGTQLPVVKNPNPVSPFQLDP